MAHLHDVGRAKHVPRELGGRQAERSTDDDDDRVGLPVFNDEDEGRS